MQMQMEQKSEKAIQAIKNSIEYLTLTFPEIGNRIRKELEDQRNSLKMIASENYTSYAVQLSMGNWLTDKYCEGFPGHRFYAGCENVDFIESQAIETAKKLFNVDHAYVQPHSGADANLVAYWSILIQKIQNPQLEKLGKKLNDLTPEEYEQVRSLFSKQTLMGMSLDAGGHLTHGYRHNVSSKMMRSVMYGVHPKTNRIDYKEVEAIALREKPLILVAGYSAYPRLIDFSIMKEIADKAGAVLMVDMAHFSGLVAGKAITGNFDPASFADVITSTTHKTLRGPRGGIVLCKEEYREIIDKGCPTILGGPLPHVIAAKAIAFQEASTQPFKNYVRQVIENAKAFADELMKLGAFVVTDGTDNHIILLNVAKSFDLNGLQAEYALRQAKIFVNRNTIAFDPNGAWFTSGIRFGTPALTTLGMKEEQMRWIAKIVFNLLKKTKKMIHPKTAKPYKSKVEIDPKDLEVFKEQVKDLLLEFPLYPELKFE